MATAVIVGCGSIGSRHLQALLRSAAVDTVWAVEPNPQARTVAAERAAEVRAPGKRVEMVSAIEAVPEHADIAVIATNSAERRSAFETLTSHARVGAVVFEKFLFPRLSDYDVVAAALARTGTPAWVNCPRRVWGGYREAQAVFGGRADVCLRQAGSGWGLGSNLVHLLDTYAFVTGRPISQIDTSRLDSARANSKRPGYVEVFGTLAGSVAGNAESAIELVCYRDGALPRLLEIVCATTRVLVDEKAGRAVWMDRTNAWSERPFGVHEVSETGFVFDAIIRTGVCGLPTFAEAATTHRLALRAIGGHLGIDIGADAPCAIT